MIHFEVDIRYYLQIFIFITDQLFHCYQIKEEERKNLCVK